VSGLGELYQQLIIDHNRHPRNYGSLEHATHRASGDNPLCGDRITLSLRVVGDVIEEIRFEGSGCAISQASASLMTTAVRGKGVAAALELFRAFHAMVTGPQDTPADTQRLGKLAAFSGVRAFPARVKCANLPWHTLRAALQGNGQDVSTE
jgi:nitrogen fixation NifU-like protein